MELPVNHFKRALQEGRQQIGLWNSINSSLVSELVASCGFDWVVVDTEHAPIDVNDVLPALQAIAAYPGVSAVVRPVQNDTALIKRLLDLGAQTLLVPYVETADEARAAVAAMRYPPEGVRGVAGLTRAGRFGKISGYAVKAASELCLIVQAETRRAIDSLEEIASVEGVDAVFLGPSDLAASYGYPGQPGHPEVRKVIAGAIERLNALGVPVGILATDPDYAKECIGLGSNFTAVGLDIGVLVNGATALRETFSNG